MEQKALERYKIMWIIVLFDLPTNTAAERKRAAMFRKELIKEGYYMLQYSVYIRNCSSRENMQVHTRRLKGFLPPEGQITMMTLTDKQYADIINYFGKREDPLPPAPQQLEMF